jgi:hypothetical protein
VARVRRLRNRFAAFAAWSDKSGKHSLAETRARWGHYSSSPPTEIGAGTLFWLAKQHRPDWQKPSDTTKTTPETEPLGNADEAAEIARLVALSPIAYDREREAAAERLGCHVTALDKTITGARRQAMRKPVQGRPLDLRVIEPWPDPVDGGVLLDDLKEAIRQYVVLGGAEAVALWALAVHAFDAWHIFPRLFITAPERAAGRRRCSTCCRRLCLGHSRLRTLRPHRCSGSSNWRDQRYCSTKPTLTPTVTAICAACSMQVITAMAPYFGASVTITNRANSPHGHRSRSQP